MNNQRPLRVFTWHIHGSYLYYLSQCKNIDFFIPYKTNPEEGYGGRSGDFPWPDNVYEVPIHYIKNIQFDCILFQSKKNYLHDQYEILSEKQRQLPKIYIEHDPPREHPTDTRHIVNDSSITLVHVTHFNNLMWDNNHTPTAVIEHGVVYDKNILYSGNLKKGIVVINNLPSRGRRLGLDIFLQVRKYIPLDLIGINSEKLGGLGEIKHSKLLSFISNYRFYFSPIRYTSLGLATIEAMSIGMPFVGLATTENASVFTNNKNGIVSTNIYELIKKMSILLENSQIAYKFGEQAKRLANKKFSIKKFVQNWEQIIVKTIEKNSHMPLQFNSGKFL